VVERGLGRRRWLGEREARGGGRGERKRQIGGGDQERRIQAAMATANATTFLDHVPRMPSRSSVAGTRAEAGGRPRRGCKAGAPAQGSRPPPGPRPPVGPGLNVAPPPGLGLGAGAAMAGSPAPAPWPGPGTPRRTAVEPRRSWLVARVPGSPMRPRRHGGWPERRSRRAHGRVRRRG
jgi:hypothetical protein